MVWRALLAGLAAAMLHAQAPPSVEPEKKWYQTLAFNGFLSGSYNWNFDQPAGRANAFRVFDFADNYWKLDVAEAVVQKAASKKGDWGFRVDLEAGQSIPEIEAAYGLFRDPDSGKAGHFDIQQAFVSYIAPIGNGLRFDAGKYVSHMGYEVIDGYDGWNDNATRSFLFGYAVPYTQTGVRVSYPFGDKLTAQLHFMNGWDEVTDNNHGKTVGFQVAYTPAPAVTLTVNGIYGPEQKEDDHDYRQVWELMATWKASRRVSFGLDALYGHEAGAVEASEGREQGSWPGAAGYLHTAVTSKFSLNLRSEIFADRNGARTGVGQSLKEVTATPEWRIDKHVILRGDVRFDWSTGEVFQKANGFARQQLTAMINLLLVD
ncbi:MAG: porin [Bryobacteraceae bacterium]|jgi:hypothetical protein